MIKHEKDNNKVHIYNIATQELTAEQKELIKERCNGKAVLFFELPEYLKKYINGKLDILQFSLGVKRWAWAINAKAERKPIGLVIIENGMPETELIIKLLSKDAKGPGFRSYYFEQDDFLAYDTGEALKGI